MILYPIYFLCLFCVMQKVARNLSNLLHLKCFHTILLCLRLSSTTNSLFNVFYHPNLSAIGQIYIPYKYAWVSI